MSTLVVHFFLFSQVHTMEVKNAELRRENEILKAYMEHSRRPKHRSPSPAGENDRHNAGNREKSWAFAQIQKYLEKNYFG